jgi:hypothetical protein
MSWEEFEASGWPSLVHPDDLPKTMDHWAATVASGQPAHIEHRVRRADGQYRWLLAHGVPLRDGLGQIVKWYGTVVDIDERKRAEETLRQSAKELKALSHQLVELQESERRRLARELHDRVGQNLTALNINLAIFGKHFPTMTPTSALAWKTRRPWSNRPCRRSGIWCHIFAPRCSTIRGCGRRSSGTRTNSPRVPA